MFSSKFLLGQLPPPFSFSHRFLPEPVCLSQRGGMTTSKAKKPPTKGLPGGPSNKTRQKLISSLDGMSRWGIHRKNVGSNTNFLGKKMIQNDSKSQILGSNTLATDLGRFIWCKSRVLTNLCNVDFPEKNNIHGLERHFISFKRMRCLAWFFIFHPGVLDDVEKHFVFRSSLEKSEFCSPLDSGRNLCILRLEGTQVWNEDHMHLLVVRPLGNTPFLFSKMYMLYIYHSELTNHHTQHLSFLQITLPFWPL